MEAAALRVAAAADKVAKDALRRAEQVGKVAARARARAAGAGVREAGGD